MIVKENKRKYDASLFNQEQILKQIKEIKLSITAKTFLINSMSK